MHFLLFFLACVSLCAENKITFFHSYQTLSEEKENFCHLLSEEQKSAQQYVHVVSVPPFAHKSGWGKDLLSFVDIALLQEPHLANLEAISRKAKNIPLFASNLLEEKKLFFSQNLPYRIYKVADIKIGVFSLLEQDLFQYNPHGQKIFSNFLVLSPFLVAKILVEKLQEKGCSYIILFSGLSLESDVLLVKSLRSIDIVMGLHKRESLAFYEKDTLIYKSSDKESFLNRLDIVIDEQRLLGVDYHVFYPHFRTIPMNKSEGNF